MTIIFDACLNTHADTNQNSINLYLSVHKTINFVSNSIPEINSCFSIWNRCIETMVNARDYVHFRINPLRN